MQQKRVTGCLTVVTVLLLLIVLFSNGFEMFDGCAEPAAPVLQPSTSSTQPDPTVIYDPSEPLPTQPSQPAQHPASKSQMCTTLTGKVCAVLLFADDDEYTWTEKDAAAFEKKYIQPGLAFLRKQAAAYDVDLTLSTATYVSTPNRPIYYDGKIDGAYTTRKENGKTRIYPDFSSATRDILDRIAANWGYDSADDLHQALLKHHNAEQIAYIIIPNREGWSYSHNGGQTEYSFVYGKDHLSRKPGIATFPHEFLHLFDADDLYKATKLDGSVVRENRAKMAERMHKNAIMFNTSYDLDDAIICGYTAYKIGWLDELPPEYDCEEWNT